MVRSRADDLDRCARATRGLERQVHALVAQDLRDDQQRVAGLTRREAVGLHRRMDHRGVASVMALDSLAAKLGDGDVGVDPATRAEVPFAYAAQLPAQQRTQQRRDLAKGVAFLIPRVAKRRIAIADVNGAVGNANAVGEGAAAAQHDIRLRKLQPLDRERVERQQASECRLAHPEALEGRCRDRVTRETPVRALLVVQQREDRSLGVEVGDRGERALGAAHDQQVVVDQADAPGQRRDRRKVIVRDARAPGWRDGGGGVPDQAGAGGNGSW